MARAVAKYRQLLCHNCNRRWGQVVWGYDENWTQPRDPITCICTTPHIEVLPSVNHSSIAQVRASQRCAVYLMPDGSVAQPATNRYDDEGAIQAVADGGVRYEFMSVRDMQRFQREHRLNPNDEFSERCMVIDHDQKTILNRETILHYRIKEEDRARAYTNDNIVRGRVEFGGDRYERAREAYRNGHRRSHR